MGRFPAGGGASSLGLFVYGDGSDGPLKFTATPRTITDGVTTVGSPILASATANFTDADEGLVLNDQTDGNGAIQFGARILSVTDATHAVMNIPAGGTAGGDTVVIGDTWMSPGNYSSVTIPTGATAIPHIVTSGNPGNGAVLCSGEYYINGTVDQRPVVVGSPPVPGGTGAGANGIGTWAPLGGVGGAGSTSSVGDTLGGILVPTYPNNALRQPLVLLNYEDNLASPVSGAAGGGDGVNDGGAGGVGGVPFIIAAKSIVHGPDAVYLLSGQPGGDAAGGNAGGGGGGPDGWWITLSDSLTGSPTITGGGGAAGRGSGTGADGTPGQAGFGVHYTPSGVTIQNA